MGNYGRVRMAGTLYAVGGALWFGWIVGMSRLAGGIPGPGSQYFSLSQFGFIILQTLLLVGFLGIWWSQGVGRGLFGKLAFGLGLLGHFLFVIAELFSLATGREDLLAVAALTTTLGLILTGIALLHAKRWHSWGRYMPLLTGIYPLVGMFPFLIISDEPSSIGIGLWGLFRLLLGLAMREEASFLTVDIARDAGPILGVKSA